MKKYFLMFFLTCIFSCSNPSDLEVMEIEENPSIPVEPEEREIAGEISVFDKSLVDDSYLLVNDALNNRVYLMDKEAAILHEWELQTGLGNDCVLLHNGELLALLEDEAPQINFGGFAGKLQMVNPDNSIEWEHTISDNTMISHHDVEMLPNGNIIILVWMKKTAEEAQENGFNFNYDIYPESVFELDPESMQIVWEWHSWNHIIQDIDETKPNFGVISEHPEKIDINYNPNESGDIMHANGIEYDEKNDLIFLSINFYSEIWVIDHSTSSEEARGNTGGNFNKGGNLIYRFGNPEVYQNPRGERLFYNNHYPNINIDGDKNTMFVFVNGFNKGQSTVYEFQFEDNFTLNPLEDNEPKIIWSYTHPDLFSQKVSGATELPNGNILITEGDYGAWEITREGEIVWKFNGDGFFWRIYPYQKGNPALSPFNLN